MQMNYTKTQAMIMGNSNFDYSLKVNNLPITAEETVKILGVTLDQNLCFKSHTKTVLQKVYCKVGALRRIRNFIPTDICIRLYKAYILLHLEYCSPILLGINKSLKTKLEAAHHYALKSLASRFGISTEFEVLLKAAASMRSLEQRRLEQSLVVLFKSLKYISDFFNHQATPYTNCSILHTIHCTNITHSPTSHHICGILCPQISKLNLVCKTRSGCRCNRCIS